MVLIGPLSPSLRSIRAVRNGSDAQFLSYEIIHRSQRIVQLEQVRAAAHGGVGLAAVPQTMLRIAPGAPFIYLARRK